MGGDDDDEGGGGALLSLPVFLLLGKGGALSLLSSEPLDLAVVVVEPNLVGLGVRLRFGSLLRLCTLVPMVIDELDMRAPARE